MKEEIENFLKHLRTIQFSLLVTCLALLAASLAEPPGDLKIAKRDLERIQQLITSYSKFDENEKSPAYIINESIKTKFSEQDSSAGIYAFKFNFFLVDLKVGNRFFHLFTTISKEKGKALSSMHYVLFDVENNLTNKCSDGLSTNLNYDKINVKLNKDISLQEFSEFWDCLLHIRIIEAQPKFSKAFPVNKDSTLATNRINNFIGIEPVHLKENEQLSNYQNILPSISFELTNSGQIFFNFDPSIAITDLQWELDLEEEDPKYIVLERMKRLNLYPKNYLILPEDYQQENKTFPGLYTSSVKIPTTLKKHKFSTQLPIINEFFPTTLEGTFKRRFPQITSWVKDRTDRSISVLLEDIAIDIEQSGKNFEVLGVKIPNSLIAKLGVVVLISIQIYFVLHIRMFINIPLTKDDMPTFPWIGIYSDKSSMCIFIISTVVVPLAIALWLLYKTWEKLGIVSTIILGIIFLAVQILMLIEYLQLRTKLKFE